MVSSRYSDIAPISWVFFSSRGACEQDFFRASSPPGPHYTIASAPAPSPSRHHNYVRAQHEDKGALELTRGAVRLSSNVIARDPAEFASQMVGRLLPYQTLPAIESFMRRIVQGMSIPWLCPLHAALHPPGTSLICTLQGHSKAVHGVALSRDGRVAVSASQDQTLRVWEVASLPISPK